MEIRTSNITFDHEGTSVPGYLAEPSDEGKYPGVVVLQEWWGLVPHIKEVTERFASAGYVALAPDLYHGDTAAEPDEARKLAMALDRERAVAECSAAAKYLTTIDQVEPKKIGVVGWCMGGALSLSTAAHNGVIGVVVAFYGRPLEAADVPRLKVPVLGLYGELDQGIPVAIVREFETQLAENNIPHEINIYPDAPHAFFNNTRPQAYREEAAEDAWNRTLNWFQTHLTG